MEFAYKKYSGSMRKLLQINLYLLGLFLISCISTSQKVNYTLNLSGNNRPELEKVINHYKQVGDKEKLEAAYYLIANMKDKYSLEGKTLDVYFEIYEDILKQYNAGIKNHKVLDSIVKVKIDSLEAFYGPIKNENLVRKTDASIIKADSLIESIDLAFEVWRSKPWAKHVNFKQFCEYILPYRIHNEPLQNWRKKFKTEYDIFADSLKNKSDPKELARKVNDLILRDWKFLDNFNKYSYFAGVNSFDHFKGGICEHHYLLLACVLRSLGVPCAIDFTPQWKHWAGQHSWMVILDTTGKMIAFNPGNPHFYYTHKVPLGQTGTASKVYRRTFEIQSSSLPANTDSLAYIPSPFDNVQIKDVTYEYDYPQSDIELTLEKCPRSKLLYLSVFGYGLSHHPIGWAKINGRRALFKSVGVPAVFLSTYYEDNKELETSEPFIFYDKDNIKQIIPDTSKKVTVRLDRKFPVDDSMHVYLNELIGGKFQGSNTPDFKDADDLFTIRDTVGSFVDKEITGNKQYRYVRFLAPYRGRINMAEIEFYGTMSNHEVKLNGRIIGDGKILKGSLNDVFDGKSASSLSSVPNSWVGLDLGHTIPVTKIRYLPRNELNGIEIGDIYELFYFNHNTWFSLGRSMADKNYLIYNNVPSGALLVLKNLSEGKDERIFTWENNKQRWW
jgi:hypothetical protein